MKKNSLAFEMGELYVKAAFFRGGSLSGLVAEPVSSQADEQVSHAVDEALRKIGARPQAACLVIPRNMVTLRTMLLPSRDPNELMQMAELQAVKIVPYKKSEMSFAYQSIGFDTAGFTKVLLSIVQVSTIRRHVSLLEHAGLAVEEVYLSSSLVREWALHAAASPGPREIHALLDVDTAYFDFLIYDREHLLFSRTIGARAGAPGDDPETKYVRLAGELKQSLVVFQSEELNQRPTKILLSGAASSAGLIPVLQKELELPVALVPSPLQAQTALPADVSMNAVAQLARGRSASRIEFVLPEVQIRKSIRETAKNLMTLGSLAALFLALLAAFYLGKLYHRHAYVDRLEKQKNELTKNLAPVIEHASKLEWQRRLRSESSWPLSLVAQLQKSITSEVVITSLRIEKDSSASVRGEAAQLSAALKFIDALEKTKSFKDVTTKQTRTKKVGDREVTDFEVTFLPSVGGPR
jgi:type II secretory pathway component PulL